MNSEESALRSYRDTGHQSFVPPPPDVIVTRARRRARTRVALAAAAVLAVSGGAAAIAAGLDRGPDRNPPVTVPSPAPPSVTTTAPPTSAAPSNSPPSSPSSPSPAGTTQRTSRAPSPVSVRGVDWENATIRITPSREDECLTGRVRFVDGIGGTSGDQPHIAISAAYSGGAATFGDLTGDGRAEAVVWASCLAGLGDEDSSGQLLVVTGRSGELVGSWVGPVGVVVEDVAIAGGRLTISVMEKYADPEVPEERTYRWNGTRYVEQ